MFFIESDMFLMLFIEPEVFLMLFIEAEVHEKGNAHLDLRRGTHGTSLDILGVTPKGGPISFRSSSSNLFLRSVSNAASRLFGFARAETQSSTVAKDQTARDLA